MKANYTPLMQSKYFSPAFNSAIFDGPFRIYFAQFHESFALKLYFMLQQEFNQNTQQLKSRCQKAKINIFIMIYPSVENFSYSFLDLDKSPANNAMGDLELLEEGNHSTAPASIALETKVEKWSSDVWNQDLVLGLKQPLEDIDMQDFLKHVHTATDLHLEKFSEDVVLSMPQV